MVSVLISDKMSPLAAEAFRDRGIEVAEAPGLEPAALAARIADYDGLAVRSATQVTASVLAQARALKVVGRAGIGVDNIDVHAATAAGVCVMNTPHGNAITTAEHAIAMMMSLARRIPMADRSTQAGKWEKAKFMGIELCGKTLGIVGCGNIGAIVADRALGLKMKVIAYDPYLSPERALDIGVEKVAFDELLARADILSLHTPLTDATRNLIDADALRQTRPGIRIVNCARGGLIVEADLKAALETGHVAGAALDVFATEPATDNALFGLPGIVTTPHLGASTGEAQAKVAQQVAEQMADYLLHGAVTNALNMPSVTAEEAPRLKPYMKLAGELGSFAGQITETGLRRVRIEYEGHVAELNTRPLTAVALQGLLAPLMDSVNMVNAPIVAKERNIEVSEVKHDRPGNYQTLIRLSVTTEKRTRDVAGTLFAGARPRIVDIEGFQVEAEVGRHMLLISNEDQPGFIGALGSTLGDAGVNIATFHLGRQQAGGKALSLIEIDEPLARPVLEQVRHLPHVRRALPLEFR